MDKNNDFMFCLMIEIMMNIDNYHRDNYDERRFGKLPFKTRWRTFWRSINKKKFPLKDYKKVNRLQPYLEGMGYLYSRLEDEASKELLVKLIAFRMIGKERIKLPLNNGAYWEKRKKIDDFECTGTEFSFGPLNRKLVFYDFQQLGKNLKLITSPDFILLYEYLKHYGYNDNGITCRVEEGDYVLDCGGCWGDTAICFANDAGANGMVYSFEFIRDNLDIFQKNLSMNPEISDRVKIIEKALWNVSDEKLFFSENGSGSKVIVEQLSEKLEIRTISIDDFVANERIMKIDFVKMDIEGAELKALEGAKNTLIKFRPKLAISLYHKPEDFGNIPAFIDSLGINYKFFLGHYTIHTEETVLYGIPS